MHMPRLILTTVVVLAASCGATCHEPEHGFTVSTRVAKGIGGQAGTRNPPALLNRIMLSVGGDRQFWDGRATSVVDALRNRDYRYRWIERTSLLRQDRDDLVAFVKACSGSLSAVEKGRLPR